MDNKNEYILCAAIRRMVKRNCFYHYKDCPDIYEIEIGYRHADILTRFNGEVSKSCIHQGFFTSKNRFVDRKDGMVIAKKAKQVSKKLGTILFSEDLY